MSAMRRKQMALSMFLINTIAAVVAPMVIFAMLGVGRVSSMSTYKNLESHGVITTNADKMKTYPNAQLSGDWGDVAIYLTEGFRSIAGPAYGIGCLLATNAIVFFLIWRSSNRLDLDASIKLEGGVTGANRPVELDYASPPGQAQGQKPGP